MRLDKFLCQLNMGSRSEVKNLIRRGQVTVNGVPATSPEQKIDETADKIICRGQALHYRPHVYFMLNKPKGIVSATRDNREKTVLDLLRPGLPDSDRKREIVPAGRLDKDTEGLLLLTDDGALVHGLLTPRNHVDKTYLVEVLRTLSTADIEALRNGVDIGEKRRTLPAKVELLDERHIRLTIHEGKFHQVKRMLQAVDNEVLALKRLSFGPLLLDERLEPGAFRELTKAEIEDILSETQKPAVSIRCDEVTMADNEDTAVDHMVDVHTDNIDMTRDMDMTRDTDMARDEDMTRDIDFMEIDAVIFDLDGTLVDSMWMWHQIDIEYLGRFGIPLPEKLQTDIEGMSFHETAVYFKERFQLEDSLEMIKENWNTMAWEKYEREVPLKPGVKAFLEKCRTRGIKLGIATSNSRALTENIVSVHGLQEYFDCIMTGCDVKRGKPAPDVYLAVADKLQVRPERCLVFEDILPGIMAGKNAGMKVCAVEDAYSADIRTQKRELADYYITDYTELS